MASAQPASVKGKFLLLIVLTLASLAILFAITLNNERNMLLHDRQEKVRNLVETASGVVAHFHQLAQSGQMSQDDAKRQAIAALRGLRYDSKEYFWINDLAPRMVLHPIKPELEGKDLGGIKDPDGKFLFKEFAQTAQEKGAGFVDYQWPKPGSDAPVAKI